MFLKDINFDEDSYLYLERYVNNGSPSGFTKVYTVSDSTQPSSLTKGFYLHELKVGSTSAIKDYGRKPAFFKWDMLTHPDMEAYVDDAIVCRQALYVSPTASSRTVKCIEDSGWFVKLAYKGLIGRIDRRIREQQAISSVEVSSIIENAINKNIVSNKLYFLREPFARTITHNDETWGIVLREAQPYPHNQKIKFQIPAFSLFSKDQHNPSDPSIIVQLIQYHKITDIESYLLENILFPIYDSYFTLLISCGLQLECHAQNTLFAIDDNFNIVGIVAKDAESIDKDLHLMDTLGINHDIKSLDYKCLNKTDYNYQIMHSFMFDFKLGEYLVSPIINEVAAHFVISTDSIQQRIKTHNQQYIKQLPKDFFPDEWYYYENILHDRTKKRPYISKNNPKYR